MAGKRAGDAPKVVAYYRVSTKKQGDSGLGLEAQRAAVGANAAKAGARTVAEFTEVETGKRSDRPELARALACARLSGATLVIAKLDRLARNARFLLGLVESGVDVVFCDLPQIPPGATGKFILTNMAAVAELEAGLISERTKAALQAYRDRGGTLGAARPECRGKISAEAAARGQREGNAAGVRAARRVAAEVGPELLRMRADGMTLRACADALNARGYQTRRGLPWTAVAVLRTLNRV